jgi:hypothetical protein
VVLDVSKDRGAFIFKGQGVQDGRFWLAQNARAELPLRIGMRFRWLGQMHKSRTQVAQATQFCTVSSDICGSSAWNLVHLTVLVPRTVWWLLEFWKIVIGRYKPVIISPPYANLCVCVCVCVFTPGGIRVPA